MLVPLRLDRACRLLVVLVVLAAVAAMATTARAAADPSLCTIAETSGSPGQTYSELTDTAYSADGRHLYTLGAGYQDGVGGVLTSLDAATGDFEWERRLPQQALQVAVASSGNLFVRGWRQDGATGHGVLWVVSPSGVPLADAEHGGGIGDLAADPSSGEVYGVVYGGGVQRLTAFGPDAQPTREQELTGYISGALAYDDDAGDLLVGGSLIRRYDADTFTAGASGPTGVPEMEHIRVAADLDRAYVLRGYQYVEVLDLATLAVLRRENVNFGPYDLEVDPVREVLYAAGAERSELRNLLRAFDATTGVPLDTQRWGIDPHGMSARPGGGMAVATRYEVTQVDRHPCTSTTDTTPPAVRIDAPAEGAELALNTLQPLVAWCSDSGSGLTGLPFNDGTFESRCRSEQNGNLWETQTSVDTSSPGAKSVTVRARDLAGNETEVTRNFTVVVPPDTQGPEVFIATPPEQAADGTPGPPAYTLDQSVPLEVYCTEPDYYSGLASCDATVDGVPVANGAPIPTDTPGPRTVRLVARDNAGNESTAQRTYRVLAGERTETQVEGPRSVTTDPGGLGATSRVPLQTEVRIPRTGSGAFAVTRQAPPAAPAGMTPLAGVDAVRVDAPGRRAPVEFLAGVIFTIDASVLPGDPMSVTLVKDGVAVPACADGAFLPDPDPCVRARQVLPGGDLSIDASMLQGDRTETDAFGNSVERFDAVWSLAVAPPDGTPPTARITTPADGATIARGATVALDAGCADEAGGSGIATCTITIDGAAAVDSQPLPTAAGDHTVSVVARDAAGNQSSLAHGYVVPAASASGEVTGPGSISTGSEATPSQPQQAQVALPAGVAGPVTVLPAPAAAPPAGFEALPGAGAFTVEAPAATAANPLRLSFTIDASLLAGPPPIAAGSIVPTRDGAPVADCAGVGATPDPCVESRATDGSGDVTIVVRTSHASAWGFVRRTQGASIADASRGEGDTGRGDMTFRITRTGPLNQAATVRWSTADGTAVAGRDYVARRDQTVRFAPRAASVTIAVPVIGDREDEGDETFLVRLATPSGTSLADAEAVGTIVDDDPPLVDIGDATVGEGDTRTRNLSFTVRLAKAWNRAVTVRWAVQDITTTAGADYVGGAAATSGVVRIAAGARNATVTVTVIGDRVREGAAERPGGPRYERLRVVLTDPIEAAIGDGEAIGRIQDDD